jgi:transposase
MTSRTNLKAIDAKNIKFIGGIPLTSNESKKIVEECEITENNELIRPSGLVYYEDQRKTLFDIPGRAIVCFNHTDLEQERSIRLKKIAIAQDKVDKIFKSDACNKNSDCLETEIKAAIKGVSDYFIIENEDGKDDIEKIFNCFKSWLEMQPVRHFEEIHIDVYIFICI